MSHIPVLLDEVIRYLDPKNHETYVDCTFGDGGYSQKILEASKKIKLIAIDQDPYVKNTAEKLSDEFKGRFTFIQDNFANLSSILKPFGLVDGIIWDLGVSSMQLDVAERGFSFAKDAYLDMRMSGQGTSAADFLNTASEQEIADVIFYNGEERQARKIARKIVETRAITPINTTKQLAEIARSVVRSKNFSIDQATKTFQAIRIFVNNELESFKTSLAQAAKLLKKDGRIICVSFHSLEDTIIKNYLRENSAKKIAISKYHAAKQELGTFEILTKKAITPSQLEVKLNPRARSAKLRAARKLSDSCEDD
jgi:16S rRNA (cytosine1402-N4)-methyltransferase